MKTLGAALLSALRSSPVHLPGGELATLLRATRDEVTRNVDELRAAGFEIEDRPGLGFRLLSAPDRLIADDLRARLGSSSFIRDILVFEETDSTNDRAAQLGEAGALGGLAIFAERQTAGRGRFGRRWDSSSHRGLWLSLLLRPAFPLVEWPRLTTWAAVSLADGLERACGLPVGIKWPNDLQIRGRKLGGILIETAADRSGDYFAVVGMGINVNHTAEEFPEELQQQATSLHRESKRIVDRAALAADLLRSLGDWYARLSSDFDQTIAAARRRSTLMHQTVAIQVGASRFEGEAVDLDPDGRLILEMPDGHLETIGAGEATVIRKSN